MAVKTVIDNGRITGYASVFGLLDLSGDRVMRGAFRQSLLERGVANIRMLFQHDPAQPIGIWTDIREDIHGLKVRGQLNLQVERAREVLALVRQGALQGLSIGFKAERAFKNPHSGTRRLERVDLWEISLVTFPMLPQARISMG